MKGKERELEIVGGRLPALEEVHRELAEVEKVVVEEMGIVVVVDPQSRAKSHWNRRKNGVMGPGKEREMKAY